MAITCDQCRKSIRGAGNRTATRVLCDDCNITYLGLTAGTMAGNGDIAQAISTAGWFARLRKGKKG